MKRRVQYPKRAWEAVGRYMAREVNKQFMTKGANFGTPWKPLAASTVMQKRKAGYPLQPLVRTGDMKRTFAYPRINQNVRGSMAVFGSDDAIALFQHGGTKMNGKRHIPKRPILKVTPKMTRDVKKILEGYIKGGTTPA